MKKKWLLVNLTVFVLFFSVSAFASEIQELKKAHEYKNHRGNQIDRVLCIDGLKVFQTIAFGYGQGTGAAVSNIQLYEEKNGKVVPVRCK